MSSKRIITRGIASLALSVLLSAGLPPVYAKQAVSEVSATQNTASVPSPSKEVEKITQGLLDTFVKNKSHYQEDPAAFIQEVDQKLSPVVAFESIARGVMGKYAHRATPAQIQAFEQNFKSSLLNFYGKALLKLGDTNISIANVEDVPEKVLQDYKAGRSRQIPVSMTVKTSSRTLSISYSMIFDDNRWKLRNVIIDGINIGVQFRRQFSEAVDKYGKVQYVVDNWLKIMTADSEHLKEKVAPASAK